MAPLVAHGPSSSVPFSGQKSRVECGEYTLRYGMGICLSPTSLALGPALKKRAKGAFLVCIVIPTIGVLCSFFRQRALVQRGAACIGQSHKMSARLSMFSPPQDRFLTLSCLYSYISI